MSKKFIYLFSFVLVLGMVLTSVAKADLVGWWRFNEGSGDTASDSSGNGHHGTLLGTPEWVSGPEGFGGALAFNPDKCMGVDCGIFDPTNGTEQFTVALWAFWDGTGDSQHFLTKSAGWGADTMMFQFELWGAHTDAAYTDRVGVSYQPAGSVAFSVMPKNEWVHLAWTFDGSDLTLYVNGVDEVGPKPFSIGPDVDAQVEIGYNSNRPSVSERTFHGSLDEFRIYDHALTEAEIQFIMQGGEGFPYASGPAPADGVLYPDIWASLSWRPGDFAVSHDVYIGDNFDDVNDGTGDTFHGNQPGTLLVVGFLGFPYPDGLVPGITYYWRIDEVNDTEPNSPWKGNVWSFSIPPKTAYNPNPADGAELVGPDVELSWTGGFGARLHTVYFGEDFDDVNNAIVGLPQAATTYTPGPLKLSKTYYWRVDEFDGIETYKGDVWSFTTQGAVGSPNPSNGAVDVTLTPVLTWSPGVYAASHQLYFGTDKDAVRNADTTSPEYKGTRALGSESYDPGKLQWYSTYYWRIDEVNNVNPDSPWTGNVWNFTTADFLIVDDFEDYNDYPPDEIWSTWIDGWEVPENGSMAGHAEPPFTETTIVHGGGQSMPLYYENNFKYSEATMTLVSVRDWTEEGVGVLSLWFRGNSDNAAERMYVALNGSAVVYHENPNAAQIDDWTEWTIDLSAPSGFAAQGVNLANVNTISIGFGDKNSLQAGGSGLVFFDDIRLYRPEPEPEPAP